ncbi:MAG: M1 family metallopeptidase [Bacteroidetes bacterium]|nr:M1 family metallopeptidase [Bacteroidota bacterium]
MTKENYLRLCINRSALHYFFIFTPQTNFMFLRLLIAACFFLCVASCSSTKKTATAKNMETINLDTLEIVASRENPYRASATKDFDLVHNKLEVSFDYSKQQLFGKTTITLQPHFYSQYSLTLDAKQFDIHELSLVKTDGSHQPLLYSYDSLELKIQLDKKYEAGETLKIFVDYTAKPEERHAGGSAAISEDKGLYFINPLGKDSTKPIQIWTQGETESNSCWFPTIDKPNQKCTDDIYITHLKKYSSLSNGTLISSVAVNDTLVTDYWKMDLKHAPYLVMMAIGDFAIINDMWRDVPVNYYVEKEYAPYAKQIFGNTPEMMEFFSQKLGFDYPWQKYSQIVVRDYVSGAMENTSATLHFEGLQRTPRELLDENNEDVISHELFHQWFGDLVTTESWSNTPLNESFATYGEYLWNEYKYGSEFADVMLNENYDKYMTEASSKNVDLIRFYYEDREDMFDRHSYEKGGLLLHYLRHIVGDDAFFKSLELYLKTNQFKAVEIHQLRLAFEEITGRDLNYFFNEWFLSSGHPVLDISYSYDADSVYVSIEQKSNIDKNLTYQLPFKVDVWYGKSEDIFEATLKKKSQMFAFKAKGKPDLIDFDAERVVLCEKKENKTTDNYIFQYRHALLFKPRLEALEKLEVVKKTHSFANDVLIEALQDHTATLREYAIKELCFNGTDKDSVLEIIAGMAKNDKESAVRKAAIHRLSLEKGSAYKLLFDDATNDISYRVVGAALKALNDEDSKKALEKAKDFESEKNHEILDAVADVYAKSGDVGYDTFFETKLRGTTGYTKYRLFYFYANFLMRMEKSTVLQGIKTIEEQGMNTNSHYLSGAAKGSLKRLIKAFDDKKKKAQGDAGSEQSAAVKAQLLEDVSNFDLITSEATDALARLGNKKMEEKD